MSQHRTEPRLFTSVIEAFSASAQNHREQTAVICGDDSLTYNQLNLRSNALAGRLSEMGVKPGDLVGVCSERRIELPVALLAILKAGAAYVPFDASYPASRLRMMAEDAGIDVLLGENEFLNGSVDQQLSFDEFPKRGKTPADTEPDRESLAYVMFTSGSTGKPKGVAVPHRGILRLVIDQDYCELGPDHTILQHSPVAFDASTFEIWGALLNGGKMVIFGEEEMSLRNLGNAIRDHDISTTWLTAGLFHAMVEERPDDLVPLRQLLTGGDVVSPAHARKMLEMAPGLTLINGYGPTENTTFTCCHTIARDQVANKPIPIGTPISGTEIHILDPESLEPVAEGQQGELFASGDGLAIGYWNNTQLTNEKFVEIDETKMYRTGDLVSRNEAGLIDFHGRIDHQVKIRGFRIELGEIETAIARIPKINQVTVVAEGTKEGADKTLIAYYVSSEGEITSGVFREALADSLPEHSIPSFYHRLEKLPLNPNGKVDRKALPKMAEILANPESVTPANSGTATMIRQAFVDVLERPDIPLHLNFFDLGASSLQIARVHERIQAALGKEFPVTDFFHYTTIASLAEYLDGTGMNQSEQAQAKTAGTSDHIAIVGLAGRFPGAPDVETFWKNLIEGRETISYFTEEELDYQNASDENDDLYIRARGIVDESDLFDARHFGITPKEAKELDPQHRLMLECAQTALENAGHDPDRFDGKIGLFCGSSQNSYLLNNLCGNPEYARKLAAGYPTNNFNTVLGNDKDFLPTRVAYKLNLKGPAVSVQCACSTSLVAVAQACESLRAGNSDMALAGGISLGFPQKRDYLYTPDGIASKDGHCRTFDSEATGTVFGEGVGLVALRRLDDALADGDNIIAVIRGFAINNDGNDKAGYAAPSIQGQSGVIAEAQRAAGVNAESIGYIEAHGTATPLGDPIEVAALTKAFRQSTSKKQYCYIGTGKTNVGHLDIAAGVTGLIKTALTVQRGQIPPLLHYKNSNPNIDFKSSPFQPVTELKKWTTEKQPRRAGVSAFGVGGTNVHMVLEEPPTTPCTIDQGTRDDEGRTSLFPLSASSPEALNEAVSRLGNYISDNSDADLNSVAATLQHGRREYDHRIVLQASTANELAEEAASWNGKAITSRHYSSVAFMFPGQGSQHVGMARDLYEIEPVFKKALEECSEIIEEQTGVDLIQLLYSGDKDSADQLKNTAIAQPAIFAIEYSLGQLWQHWSLTPACMIGHSIGEFAAACIAGVFSLPDALGLICLRGKLMAKLPGGAMISVRASAEEIEPYLSDDINLAAVNGASSCVIAGPYEAADQVETKLVRAGIAAKRLHTSHAFHSSMMDPIVREFERAVKKLSLDSPRIPILSTVTCDWLSDEEAKDPHYWASHLRKAVRFYDAVAQLWEMPDHLLLEVGPGRTLATLAGQNPDRTKAQPSLASLPHPTKTESSYSHIRKTLGQLWCHGISIDWDLAEERETRPRRIPLPTYPFQRQQYWIEPETVAPPASPTPVNTNHFSEQTQQQTIPQSQFMTQTATPPSVSNGIETALKETLSDLSGIEPSDLDGSASFLELGFDSLLLTQAGKEIQDRFGVKVSLRQLIDEFSSLDDLTGYIEQNTDPSKFAPASPATPEQPQAAPAPQPMPQQPFMPQAGFPMMPIPQMPVEGMPQYPMPMVFYAMPYPPQQMMQPMPQQPQVQPQPQPPAEPKARTEEKPATVSGPTTVIEKSTNDELSSSQKEHIDRLVRKYTGKTRRSKELTDRYRQFHADPRTASGFNRAWKEMVYQIVTERSEGSRLLDVDGNEYIDILNGFGPGFLGHSPDFLVSAIEQQLHKGFEVGPQCQLAMEASELFCEVTGNERTSFVCTGSEAVQAAMRLARTVTQRDKIVIFARDYHGNFDEVLVKGVNRGTNLKTLPSAPGIPRSSTGNMIVLPYGTDESLEIIRGMANDLAAVIVEPVQSRRPEFRPRDFIREVREITEKSGSLFVFDEVVTGFRFGPRGAQEYYGVEADLCTYGKVIGGGMPLGVVSGKAAYMDTFDGGMWQYGDDSFPEQPVTFFAGTFVRHPLAMASVKAMLEFFKEQPTHFWNQVNAKGDRLAGTVNQFFEENGLPIEMPNCGSLMFVRMGEDQKYGNLFFYHLREKGIFILEGFPSYMTAAHSDEDIDYTIEAFKESAHEMQAAGFFNESAAGSKFDGPKLTGPPPILSEQLPISKPKSDSPVQSAKKFLAPLTVPTTEPQREVLVASRLSEGASCAFNESASLKFKGDLDVDALEEAFSELVERHDALRATFSEDGYAMTVHPEMAIDIEYIDLRKKGSDRLEAILHVDASTPYDLERGPLVRPMLLQVDNNEHHFVISAHHLVCDGWSYNVIAEELCDLYNAARAGVSPKLKAAKQYVDHAREVSASLKGEEHQRQEAYWLEQFADIPDPIELPLDRPYQLDRSFGGSTYEHHIDRDTYEAVKKAGGKLGSTLYSTLAAAYQLMLHRLTGQDDIVVCIPAAGQNDGENTDNLVGHCVNFLPLRSRYNQEDGFDTFLKQSRGTLLSATDNRSFTYGELIQKLDIDRDPRRMPLLEVAFNVERMDYFGEWDGLDVVFEPNGKSHVHYTMFMNIVESVNGLRIDVDYNTDVLDEETIATWVGYFESLLRSIAEDPSRRVDALSMMDSTEFEQVTTQWNALNQSESYPEETVQALFEKQVSDSPDAIALVGEDFEISYRELNQQANSVASALRKENVQPGDFVAIMAHRSPEIVAGLIGILKAGAAYVPISPDYPNDRIAYMLEDTEAPVVLLGDDMEIPVDSSPARFIPLCEAIHCPVSQAVDSHDGDPEDLAYVIYTSGSTGKPKGTMIPHRGIVRLVKDTDYIDFDRTQTFLLSAPISFDASTLELWAPLLNGAKLALMPAGTPNLSDIGSAIARHGVTTLWLTSGLFSLMVDERPEDLKGLKQLLSGGDVLSKEHVEKAVRILGEDGKMINAYGPTENTTFTTCHTVTKQDFAKKSIPIGKPIRYTQCYILDEKMQPVAPGIKGRLYIGGDGLAIGYLNQPELTKEKFIASPLPGVSGKLYDSGDECRWLKDGTIEFIGRADRQVKLRGFRIEPGEIENALLKHPDIARAAIHVVGTNSANKKLVAYLVKKESHPINEDDLRRCLGEQLPDYMVPGEFVFVDELPVTANGKVDYRALERLTPKQHAVAESKETLALSKTEERIAQLWDEVLECGPVQPDDNFFKIGGHSLAGLKLFTRIQREFGKDLPLATLFQAPTVRLLAARIGDDKATQVKAGKKRLNIVTQVSEGDEDEAPLFLIHGGDGGTLFYKPFVENIEAYQTIYTVEAPIAVDREMTSTPESIEKAAELYMEYIRDVYDGNRFAIGGYSFGGVLAYELARQLRESGKNVEKLFLFDTNNPANEDDFKNNFVDWMKSSWENIDEDTFLEKISHAQQRFNSKVKDKTQFLRTRSAILRHEKENLELDDELRVAFINEEHDKIMKLYDPKPYHGETYLFRAHSSKYHFDREMGWKDLIPNLSVCDIAGRHMEIFDSPNVEVLVERFNELFTLYA